MASDDTMSPRLSGLAAAVDQLGAALDAFEADDEDARSVVARLLHIAAWARTLLDTSEPDLVSQGMIDRAMAAVEAVTTHFTAYATTPDAAHLTNAGTYADQFLDGVAGWPLPPEDKKEGLAKREIADLRKLATRATADAEKQIERLDERLDEQRADGERLAQEMKDSATAQVNGATVKVEELKSTIDEQVTRLDAALTQFAERLDTESAAHKTGADEVLGEIKSMRDEAKELLGVIGRAGMTAGYEQYETQELNDADRWRLITMSLGLLAVAILAVAVWIGLAADEVDTNVTVAKATLTATVLGLATYSAKQAKRHRDNATDARRRALALASIGPYLQPLEKTRQDAVLEDFAFLFFAFPESDSSEDSVVPASALGAFADRMTRRRQDRG
jgi:hypothetical protein